MRMECDGHFLGIKAFLSNVKVIIHQAFQKYWEMPGFCIKHVILVYLICVCNYVLIQHICCKISALLTVEVVACCIALLFLLMFLNIIWVISNLFKSRFCHFKTPVLSGFLQIKIFGWVCDKDWVESLL